MTIRELHNKAIEFADMAVYERFNGRENEARDLLNKAYNFEKEAALLAIKQETGEPTQSVLLKSAASMAINCSLLRESEKLISLALSHDIPKNIAEELRKLLEEVNFNRHLDLNGIKLHDNELQFVIAGNSVSFGMAKSKDIFDRVDIFEKLTTRTTERFLGYDFRERGNIKKSIKNTFHSYISVPRAASMAFTIRLGEPSQQIEIPGTNNSFKIIDDIIENISLVNESKEEEVRKRIQNELYFKNFISLSKELAPDGKDISLIGITVLRRGKEEKTQLTRLKEDFSSIIERINKPDISNKNSSSQRASGILTFADSEKQSIKLIGGGNHKQKFIVPEGMGDIVRKYWEEQVVITYLETTKGMELIDIDIDKDSDNI